MFEDQYVDMFEDQYVELLPARTTMQTFVRVRGGNGGAATATATQIIIVDLSGATLTNSPVTVTVAGGNLTNTVTDGAGGAATTGDITFNPAA